jgi:hypothetical protein
MLHTYFQKFRREENKAILLQLFALHFLSLWALFSYPTRGWPIRHSDTPSTVALLFFFIIIIQILIN